DLLLRDGNLSLVVLDLLMNPPADLRKIPATVWHRWRNILEPISTALLVLTPGRMASSARARVELRGRFSLSAIEPSEEQILLNLEISLKRGNQAASRNETPALSRISHLADWQHALNARSWTTQRHFINTSLQWGPKFGPFATRGGIPKGFRPKAQGCE